MPDGTEPSIRELARALDELGPDADEELLRRLEADPRKGARELARRHRRRREEARRQQARWRALCDPEQRLQQSGYTRVAGVDEAGRGPLAGPVVAAAVVLPSDFFWPSLDDSKRMSPRAREAAFEAVTGAALGWATGSASPAEIDRHNILGAVHLAMARALNGLDPPPDFALVDGRPLTACPVPHQAIVGGDGRSRTIAAASVVAKVTRDRLMVSLDASYPGYGFAVHKGYGTAEHRAALARLGPTPLHRRSFLTPGRQLDLLAAADPPIPQRWGERAEEVVAAEYLARGYRLVARRWRGGGGELDLVCAREGEVVFVEVKGARGEGAGDPAGWLRPDQRRRWRRAAAAWLEAGGGGWAQVRFDLVGVRDRPDGPPETVRFEGVEP